MDFRNGMSNFGLSICEIQLQPFLGVIESSRAILSEIIIIECKYFTTPSDAKCQIINYNLAKLLNGKSGQLRFLEI